ncbi:MAG: hypothetical protein AB7O62_00210 [Pirellulales bacterium]
MNGMICPHCGEAFAKTKVLKIPTHDFPKPCRSVCPGSGQKPKLRLSTPLWKDDPAQRGRDFFDEARMELLLCGFAIVKEMAIFSGQSSGQTTCPLCGKQVRFAIAKCNGHCAAKCETKGCIHAQE